MGGFSDWIKKYGACIMISLTIAQALIFLGYSAYYTYVYHEWYPDSNLSRAEIY